MRHARGLDRLEPGAVWSAWQARPKEVFLHCAFYDIRPATGAAPHPRVVMRGGRAALLPCFRPGDPAAAPSSALEGRHAAVLLANHGPAPPKWRTCAELDARQRTS